MRRREREREANAHLSRCYLSQSLPVRRERLPDRKRRYVKWSAFCIVTLSLSLSLYMPGYLRLFSSLEREFGRLANPVRSFPCDSWCGVYFLSTIPSFFSPGLFSHPFFCPSRQNISAASAVSLRRVAKKGLRGLRKLHDLSKAIPSNYNISWRLRNIPFIH